MMLDVRRSMRLMLLLFSARKTGGLLPSYIHELVGFEEFVGIIDTSLPVLVASGAAFKSLRSAPSSSYFRQETKQQSP
jgi:hypothetical protein